MKKILFLLLLSASQLCLGQTTQKANYPLAARFAPKKLNKMVFSTTVEPHWLKKSDRFWYTYESPAGKKWYLVDPVKGEKKLLFDNAKLAAEISKIVKDPFDAQHLGIDSLRFVRDENWVRFEVKSSLEIEKKDSTAKKGTPAVKEKKIFYFEYNVTNEQLVELVDFKKSKRPPVWASISPDSTTVVFVRNFNLYWMDKINFAKALLNEKDSTIVETQLTTDGVEHYSYGESERETNVDREKNKNNRKRAAIFWSPDSKKFSMIRTDFRKVKDLWVINSIAEPRPTLETYKYPMPGEKELPQFELILIEIASKITKKIPVDVVKDQSLQLWSAPELANTIDDTYQPILWHGTTEKFYFTRTARDLKRIAVMVADVKSGTAKALIEERLNTYVEVRRTGLVEEGKELVHWSERDGWGHFYLYDETGKLKLQLTSGSFHCENIVGIDSKKRLLFFTANGREPNEDPYYLHLYSIKLDGSQLKLLNPGDYDHSVGMNDNQRFFVNNFSRVNTAPASTLYAADGRKIMELETTDLSALFAAGYKFPQPFRIKADDGITDLYGVMYKPFNFDSTQKYPLIQYVYPGPQTEAVNKAWGKGMDRIDRLAQLGFIVVTVGNRGGSPARSKWYHNYGYGNLRDYGLADKKAAVEQLGDRFRFIDVEKVGIHGHSGGGFMSTAALMVYPDVFKVAVSSAGNHDNAVYNHWWSEKHHGIKEVISEKGDTSFVYAIEKNPAIVKNLKGRLLLSHGEIDNNVHPANTFRVVNALIKANKRFDMIVLPTQRHGFGTMTDYFFWKMADYFSYHLLGDTAERDVDVKEINQETEQNK